MHCLSTVARSVATSMDHSRRNGFPFSALTIFPRLGLYGSQKTKRRPKLLPWAMAGPTFSWWNLGKRYVFMRFQVFRRL